MLSDNVDEKRTIVDVRVSYLQFIAHVIVHLFVMTSHLQSSQSLSPRSNYVEVVLAMYTRVYQLSQRIIGGFDANECFRPKRSQ